MTISVIIPVYNAEAFLEKAVQSVLQFSEVKEVLLIDDASKDNSLQTANQLAATHQQVRVLQHPDKKNHGVSATRNLGIDQASQEFIAFLDADDYWLPNRFDAEREYFKDPKTDGVFGAIETDFISEEGKKQYLEKFGSTMATVGFAAEGKEVFEGLVGIRKNFAASFSMIALTIRKSALENPELRLSENLKIGEDKEFIIKLAFHTYLKSGIITEPVAMRSAHDSNTITSIKPYSISFFENDTLLYRSLFEWASRQKDMPAEVLEDFKCRYLSYRAAAKKGLAKYLDFVSNVLLTPGLLRTRYRYHALKDNSLQ